MKNCKVICRRATKDDDISSIAKYLHLTDPYIYPTICSDPCGEFWKKVISDCYFAKNNLFSMENIIVAELEGRIVGVLCVIECGERKRFVEDISFDVSADGGMSKAVEGYFDPLIEESAEFEGHNVTNVCVDEECRGMGIGSKLLECCLEYFGESTVHLDVIADNSAAVKLYEKMGFVKIKEYFGFSGNESLLPCYHMERAPKSI